MRDALMGRRRFAEFQKTGAPSDVLAKRLDVLVDEGLLCRRPYREPGKRIRHEYLPTEAGQDLLPILAALMAWGDQHRPTGRGPATFCIDEETGRPTRLAFTDGQRPVLESRRIRMLHHPEGGPCPTP
ncbi:transcriptional regulator [Streptomyces sp. SID8361]|uniref:winged helix-turn-helix transcriptional regulator n=1 Tax=Streptomyces sp. MnatMP-M27 TaxID=1839768 RepID=UPI000B8A1865|nr:helix-turn-helix domain-containing protein [Streptomyces sp. MnatMP-M27]MYU11153.1 transcriptional regulator [Streptomyces sp. SID8361]